MVIRNFSGIRDESGEIIIGTSDGVIKVRSVRRKPTHEERWNEVQINEMKGTPHEPTPGRDTDLIGVRIEPRDQREETANGSDPELPVGVEPIKSSKSFRIEYKDIEKFGPTEACKGCEHKLYYNEN